MKAELPLVFDDLQYVGWAGLSTRNESLMRQQWARYAHLAAVQWGREVVAESACRLATRRAQITSGVAEIEEDEVEREGMDGSGTPFRKEAWDSTTRDLVYEHLYYEKLQAHGLGCSAIMLW